MGLKKMIKQFVAVSILGMVAMQPHRAIAATPPTEGYHFVCPEALPDDRTRTEHIAAFIYWMKSNHPNATLSDVLSKRYEMLQQYHCTKTLQNIQKSLGMM